MNTLPQVHTNTGATCSACGCDRIIVLSATETTIKEINGKKVKVLDYYEQPVCLKCDSIGKEILSKQEFSKRKNSVLVKTTQQFISSPGNIVCAQCGSRDVYEQHAVAVNANTQKIIADDKIDYYCEDCEDYTQVIWC
jgi:Zn finger protein HypA/HybF involved in hydrogenase expression